MYIPKQVLIILKLLNQQGYEAYLIGGCVRDLYLNKLPEDYDIATNALPDAIMQVFAKFKLVLTGINHGTITVIIEQMPIEITTYRVDGEYLDNRRPEQVTFTLELERDALRRDFTMNAMAYHPTEGLFDFCGGQEDIIKKSIRAVGNPEQRFREDGLRMLRALRFAAVLGFSIEDKTKSSIILNCELLTGLAKERVQAEFSKLLLGLYATSVLLEFRQVLEFCIPELRQLKQMQYEKSIQALKNTAPKLGLRLACCLQALEVGEVKAVLQGLKYSKSIINEVTSILLAKELLIQTDKLRLKKALQCYGQEVLEHALSIMLASTLEACENIRIQKSVELLAEIIREKPCISLKSLAIDGQDLQDLGITQGKQIGEILQQLLLEVMSEQLVNEKSHLYLRAEKLKKDGNA
ncbi:MAG: CCA tRNA nucleotidyltransferase [Clostridia bacterium]